jgi:hypothetical protein
MGLPTQGEKSRFIVSDGDRESGRPQFSFNVAVSAPTVLEVSK